MCYWRAPERERERESSKIIGMAKHFGHSFRSVNNNYHVLSHRLCEIGCKDTKLSANNLLSPRKINKSSRKRAGKAVSSFCGRCKEFLFQPLTNGQVVETIAHAQRIRHATHRLFFSLLITPTLYFRYSIFASQQSPRCRAPSSRR